MAEDLFYVGISEPDELRRYVLESSKLMIMMLKQMEEFKSVRGQKLELQKDYNQIMKQIMLLCNKIKKEFPEVSSRIPMLKTGEKEKAKSIHKKKPAKKEEKEQPKPKEVSELERLEKEMDKIEKKLKGLK